MNVNLRIGEIDMEKAFEPQFAEVQAGMVSLCLEYCGSAAGEVYIVAVYDDDGEGAYSFESNFFFGINNKIYKKEDLQNNLGDGVGNVPEDRLYKAVRLLNKDVKTLIQLCKEHNRPIPTVTKLFYDVQTGNLEADYNYDSVDDTARVLTQKWIESLEGK